MQSNVPGVVIYLFIKWYILFFKSKVFTKPFNVKQPHTCQSQTNVSRSQTLPVVCSSHQIRKELIMLTYYCYTSVTVLKYFKIYIIICKAGS